MERGDRPGRRESSLGSLQTTESNQSAGGKKETVRGTAKKSKSKGSP